MKEKKERMEDRRQERKKKTIMGLAVEQDT